MFRQRGATAARVRRRVRRPTATGTELGVWRSPTTSPSAWSSLLSRLDDPDAAVAASDISTPAEHDAAGIQGADLGAGERGRRDRDPGRGAAHLHLVRHHLPRGRRLLAGGGPGRGLRPSAADGVERVAVLREALPGPGPGHTARRRLPGTGHDADLGAAGLRQVLRRRGLRRADAGRLRPHGALLLGTLRTVSRPRTPPTPGASVESTLRAGRGMERPADLQVRGVHPPRCRRPPRARSHRRQARSSPGSRPPGHQLPLRAPTARAAPTWPRP